MDEILNPRDFINANERFIPPRIIVPKIDEYVSRIVGKNVLVKDPRLINLVIKWKRQNKRPIDSLEPDNFFKDPAKIKELIETFR